MTNNQQFIAYKVNQEPHTFLTDNAKIFYAGDKIADVSNIKQTDIDNFSISKGYKTGQIVHLHNNNYPTIVTYSPTKPNGHYTLQEFYQWWKNNSTSSALTDPIIVSSTPVQTDSTHILQTGTPSIIYSYSGAGSGWNHPMTKNGVYYFTSANAPYTLIALNSNLQLLWSISLPGESGVTSPYVDSANQYLYQITQGYMSVVNLANRNVSNYTLNTIWSEVYAYEEPYFYSAESDGLHKRYLSNGAQVSFYSAPASGLVPSGPIIVGNVLYWKHPTNSTFMAFDKNNLSTPLWSVNLAYNSVQSYNTPTYGSANGVMYLAADYNRQKSYVYAINLSTHSIIWTADFSTGAGGNPIGGIEQPLTYSSSINQVYVPLYTGDANTGHYVALNASNGSTVWSRTYDRDNGWHALRADDNYLYTISNANSGTVKYYCIDQATGTAVQSLAIPTGSWCGLGIVNNGAFYQGTTNSVVAVSVDNQTTIDQPYKGGTNQYNTNYVPGSGGGGGGGGTAPTVALIIGGTLVLALLMVIIQ